MRSTFSSHPHARSALAATLSAVLFASAVFVVPRAPHAQGTAAAPAKTGSMSDAKAHMDKGQGFFLEKKFAEAAVEFRAAYQIKPFSTFLFNEAVCHEKLKNYDEAIKLFKQYIDIDPNAPDKPNVLARIAKLEAERDAVKAGGDAGAAPDAGGPPAVVAATIDEMRSIVVVESVPDNAPVEIWQKTSATAGKFTMGQENAGWVKVASGVTTFTQSLPLGTYHVVLPKFQDFRATETDVTVAAATISMFKANLSQGAFFGVMKVRTLSEAGEVRGAHVFLKKDGEKTFVDRGVTPYEESLESGMYSIRVEQPGFKPMEKKLEVIHGKIDEQNFNLDRTEEGLIRVEVTGADTAEVLVDGKEIGTWTMGAKIETSVPAGTHRVKVKADDRKTWVADVDVPKGQMIVVHTELKPSVARGSAWTSAISAAVFLGAGIYLGVQSNKLRDELDAAKASARLDQEDPRIKRGQYFAIGADACYAVGGVLALISIYNFIKDPLPPSKGYTEKPRDFDSMGSGPVKKTASIRLTPAWSPSFTGFALSGEF